MQDRKMTKISGGGICRKIRRGRKCKTRKWRTNWRVENGIWRNETFASMENTTTDQTCIALVMHNTLCSKKDRPLIFDNNFGKCGPIFEILPQIDLSEKFPCTNHNDFHLACNLLLHYLMKVENPKMLLIFTASSTNCWHVPKDTLRTWYNALEKIIYDLSNGAILNDLERTLPPVSRSRHSLTLNIPETLRDT